MAAQECASREEEADEQRASCATAQRPALPKVGERGAAQGDPRCGLEAQANLRVDGVPLAACALHK